MKLPGLSFVKQASAGIASTLPREISMPWTVMCLSLQRLLSALLATSRRAGQEPEHIGGVL
jgi:hypothetical protein